MKDERLFDKLNPYYRKVIGIRDQVTDYDVDEPKNLFARMLIRFIRFCVIFGREVRNDILWERAASLTYTTILSLFPLLVLVTSLGAAFYEDGQEEAIFEYVMGIIIPDEESTLLAPVLGDDMLQGEDDAEMPGIAAVGEMMQGFRERAPQLGFIGLIGLLITAFALYNSIENAFESSWATGRKRTFYRTISGFTFLIVVAPIILGVSIAASSLLVSLLGRDADPRAMSLISPTAETTNAEEQQSPEEFEELLEALGADPDAVVADLREAEPDSSLVRPTLGDLAEAAPPEPERRPRFDIVRIIIGLITPLFNSMMLAAAYMMIPQAKVRVPYALLGGLAAGFMWELAKVGFFYYVYTSAVRREIFASLGAVPIFLVWIYFTWIVFLLGNELVYVTQNLPRLMRVHFGRKSLSMIDGKAYIAMALVVSDSFLKNEKGISREDIVRKLRLGISDMEEVMRVMTNQGILHVTQDERVVMGKSPERLKIRTLLELGPDSRNLCDKDELKRRPEVRFAINEVQKAILGAHDEMTVAELLAQYKGATPEDTPTPAPASA